MNKHLAGSRLKEAKAFNMATCALVSRELPAFRRCSIGFLFRACAYLFAFVAVFVAHTRDALHSIDVALYTHTRNDSLKEVRVNNKDTTGTPASVTSTQPWAKMAQNWTKDDKIARIVGRCLACQRLSCGYAPLCFTQNTVVAVTFTFSDPPFAQYLEKQGRS